jgi:hypothetical protein
MWKNNDARIEAPTPRWWLTFFFTRALFFLWIIFTLFFKRKLEKKNIGSKTETHGSRRGVFATASGHGQRESRRVYVFLRDELFRLRVYH